MLVPYPSFADRQVGFPVNAETAKDLLPPSMPPTLQAGSPLETLSGTINQTVLPGSQGQLTVLEEVML
jgi:hypothetical protein